MSGYVLGMCGHCDALFTSKPEIAPVVLLGGELAPLCQGCVGRFNALRRRNGQAEIVVLPGAYSNDDDNLGIYLGE